MGFKPGESGFKGRKHVPRKNGRPGSGHTLAALTRLRREPVAELIKLADESQSVDYKTSIWKYLLEQRDTAANILGTAGLSDVKADLAALEAGDKVKPAEQAG